MEKKVGNLPTKMEVDHIKPLIKRGTNKASNLKVVTRFQNRSKGDRTK
jgi:5-methylcytosine-specific restriction endonuclease McrA